MQRILETERLLLREFIEEDAEELFVLENDPEVMSHAISYPGVEVSFSDCEKAVKRQRQYYKKHPGLGIWVVVLKDNSAFVGWAGLKHVDHSKEIEMSMRFQKTYWNQGFAAEIGAALIRYGFEVLDLKRIVAASRPEHGASKRFLEKIGMHLTDPRRFYEADVHSYVIERPSEM